MLSDDQTVTPGDLARLRQHLADALAALEALEAENARLRAALERAEASERAARDGRVKFRAAYRRALGVVRAVRAYRAAYDEWMDAEYPALAPTALNKSEGAIFAALDAFDGKATHHDA